MEISSVHDEEDEGRMEADVEQREEDAADLVGDVARFLLDGQTEDEGGLREDEREHVPRQV